VEAARLASELEPVADRIEAGAAKYESKLAELDAGVRAIIAAIKAGQTTPGDFPRQIRDLAQAARVSMASADGLANSVGNNESLSRSLRVPFRRIRLALGRVVEASGVIQQWETALG
jgi:predicted Zn-dependent peptidase